MKTRKVRVGSRQTRRRCGGALLGEGVQGKTYDAGCVAGESFCDLLEAQKDNIVSVSLYTTGKPVKITGAKQIQSFVAFIHGLKDKIAKVFKPVSQFSKKTLQEKLDEELLLNRKMTHVYGKDAETYLTVAPIEGFEKYKILGAVIFLRSGDPMYVVFGNKCAPHFKIHVKKFCTDILESLVVLQSKNYFHSDIKIDNIVQCDEKYKLIDWGAAGTMTLDNKTIGSRYTNSPLRWYTQGSSPLVSKSVIPIRTIVGGKSYLAQKHFREVYARILKEFDAVLAEEHTRKELFETYKKSFDVFSLGMTLLYSAMENDVRFSQVLPIVEKFTSLRHPMDAKVALKYVHDKL